MQTSYSNEMPVASKGMLADLGPKDVLSAVVEISGGILVGSGVVEGDDALHIKLATAQNQIFRGVVLATHTKEQATNGDVKLAQKATANLLQKGRVWVEVGAEVASGDDAYLDVGGAGVFTNVAEGNIPTGGKFRYDSDTELNLSILDINLPQAVMPDLITD
jgi:hypothetical protein